MAFILSYIVFYSRELNFAAFI